MAWFDKTFDEFSKLVEPFKGRPITYVEIGVWKGDSAAWMCENILTHDMARGFGFDPYPEDAKHSLNETLAIHYDTKKRLSQYLMPIGILRFDLHMIDSVSGLNNFRTLSCSDKRMIDLLYIDGDHTAGAVVQDWCAAWPWLVPGSVVIFDDYGIGKRKHHRHVPEAFEAIKLAFADMIEVIHEGPLQAAVRVFAKEPPLEEKMARLAAIRARSEARRSK
jgi:predicted O-methyltransferase YrrM